MIIFLIMMKYMNMMHMQKHEEVENCDSDETDGHAANADHL